MPSDSALTIDHVPAELLSRLQRLAAKYGTTVEEYVLEQIELAAQTEEEEDAKTVAAYQESLRRSAAGEVHHADDVLAELRAKHFPKSDA